MFEEQIRGYGLGENQRTKTRELLDTLIQASYVYQEILECSASTTVKGRRSLRTLLNIGASYRVLLLSVLSKDANLPIAKLESLLSAVESFNMRWVLVGKNAQELESLYQVLANGLRTGSMSVEDAASRLAVEAPSDNLVQAVFNEQVLSSGLVKLILLVWSEGLYSMRKASRHMFASMSKKDVRFGDFEDIRGVEFQEVVLLMTKTEFEELMTLKLPIAPYSWHKFTPLYTFLSRAKDAVTVIIDPKK